MLHDMANEHSPMILMAGRLWQQHSLGPLNGDRDCGCQAPTGTCSNEKISRLSKTALLEKEL